MMASEKQRQFFSGGRYVLLCAGTSHNGDFSQFIVAQVRVNNQIGDV